MSGRKWPIAWLVANLVLIWGNSLLPGDISGAVSDWVKDLILGIFFPGEGPDLAGGGLVRKLAHFLEFASLGMALSLHMRQLAKNRIWALVCGIGVACVDEGIQRFVPDRYGCVADVCLDSAGVLFGMMLFWAGCKLYQQKKNKNILEEMK